MQLLSCIIAVAGLGAVSGFAPADTQRTRIMTGSRKRIQSLPPLQSSIPDQVRMASPATPLEKWCMSHLEDLYSQSIAIKCPFFRRRAADAIDALDMILRFLIIRHKSLGVLPPLGCRATSVTLHKNKHLSIHEIKDIIQKDWHEHNGKGYYITGRLNTTIYRDDCFFDGPDPDMPVKGLRKYLSSASQLFDVAMSESKLRSLRIGQEEPNTIVATWRMAGVLRLPWRPSLPTMTGTTTYHLDDDGLIYLHSETWDLSVPEAFLKTFYPPLGEHIWDQDCI